MNTGNSAVPGERQYRCHTEIAPAQQCGLVTWGNTPYCRWHNVALSVFVWRIMLAMEDPRNKHLRGIPFRARYDPEFANVFWRSCHTARGAWVASTVRALAGGVALLGALVFTRLFPLPANWVRYLYLGPGAVALVSFMCLFAGSTNLLYPKLLFSAALALIAFLAAEWLVFGVSDRQRVTEVAMWAVTLILGFFPLFPPKSRTNYFDARDKLQLPPSSVMGPNYVLLLLAVTAWLVYQRLLA
jgi:hypothetical protein